jgi:hypothetical protein
MKCNVYDHFMLTKNNHLRYWFNQDIDQHWRQNPLEIASCTVAGGWRPEYVSFNTSLQNTATELYLRHGSEFVMFLSGGLDSEVAMRTFLANKMPVTPLVVKFANDLNVEDVNAALYLCQELALTPTIVDFDPVVFFHSGEWRRMAEDYQCYSFYQQMLLSIAEKCACPLITIDEIELQKYNGRWWFVKKEDQDGCWHRFVEKTSIPAYNNFYTYDPATIYQFMQSPTVRELINDKIPGKLGWTSSKHAIYTELTGMVLKRRPKRHGMERMMHIWDYILEHSARILHESPQAFRFSAHQLCNIDILDGLTCHSAE